MKTKYLPALFSTLMAIAAQPALSAPLQTKDARMALGEHIARLGHLSLHYAIGGKGPLIVVQAPGWGIGTEYLKKGLAPLRGHFTVLTYDPRGTAGSTPVSARDHLTNADLAGDLERLRAYLGLDTINLVGHSNGSAIAILYAEQHPRRVRNLVLIGSQLLGYRGAPGPAQIEEDARRKAQPQFATYSGLMHSSSPHSDAEFTRDFKGYAGYFFYDPAKDLPTLLSSMTTPMSVSMNKAFNESPPATKAPPLSDLGKIAASTLIVEGRQDPACPLSESERISSGIKGSRLLAIDHSGHFPWIEQPSLFFDPVIAFLSSRQTAETD